MQVTSAAQQCRLANVNTAGVPGFVRVAADGCSLAWPDYVGNNMFQTLVSTMTTREKVSVRGKCVSRVFATAATMPRSQRTDSSFCCCSMLLLFALRAVRLFHAAFMQLTLRMCRYRATWR